MAKIYHIKHSPAHHIKRELKNHSDSNKELIHNLIENNKQLQENMSHVLKGLNELVSALKSAGDEPEEELSMQAETPTTAGGGDRLTLVEQIVSQLIEQNKQIMDHLKRIGKPGVI